MSNIAPTTKILAAARYQSLTWKDALGELIDNSFDAAAKRVQIAFGRKSVEVVDDGKGCADIDGMLTEGHHEDGPTTQLGRYGVGLKDTAQWLWGELRIDSVHRGKRYIQSVDWDRLYRQSSWEIPDPVIDDAHNSPSGMVLKFTRSQKQKPGNMQQLADQIGKAFMPALQSGLQITIRPSESAEPIVCQAFSMPPLESVVEDEFEIQGKAVSIRFGVVQPHCRNPLKGFLFLYGHRTIEESAVGANGMSPARVCGVVRLGKGWTLARNKNSLVNEAEQEELASAIFLRIHSLLEKGQQQAMELTGEVFSKQLNERFKAALTNLSGRSLNAREKRNASSTDSGRVEPVGSGRRRKNAKKTQPGDRIADAAGRFSRSGRIEWSSLPDDAMGHVDLPGNVIWLNENNASLQSLKAEENTSAVLMVALSLFASQVIDHQHRDKFPWAKNMDSFSQVLAHCAAATAVHQEQPSPEVGAA